MAFTGIAQLNNQAHENSRLRIEQLKTHQRDKTASISIIEEVGKQLFEWHLSALWVGKNQLYDSEKKFMLIKTNNTLLVQAVDMVTKTCSYCQLNLQQDIEEEIEQLKNCQVINFTDGMPHFGEPHFTWSNQHYTLYLSTFKDLLIWSLKTSGEAIIQRIMVTHKGTLLEKNKCASTTIEMFKTFFENNALNSPSYNEYCIAALKRFQIHAIKKNKSDIKPFQVYVKSISAQSYIEKKIEISFFYWAVTLIADGRGSQGNHAAIIIEGLDDNNQYFIHKAEFDGKNIKSEKINENEAFYEERTEVWIRNNASVRNMLDLIEKQKKNPPSFSLLGADSMFSSKHNCFTWAKKMLKIADIHLPRNLCPIIISRTKDVTQKPDYYRGKTPEYYL